MSLNNLRVTLQLPDMISTFYEVDQVFYNRFIEKGDKRDLLGTDTAHFKRVYLHCAVVSGAQMPQCDGIYNCNLKWTDQSY